MLVAIGACDPIAGVQVRQALAPAPAAECVRAALSASPFVTGAEWSEAISRPPAYALTLQLQDSLGLAAAMPPKVEVVPVSADTSELRVYIGYFHATTVSEQRARRLAAVATPIVARVHDTCVPSSPMPPSCRIVGPGRSKPCEPPANER